MENSAERNTTYQVHMEKFTLEYSMKNISFLGKHHFIVSLTKIVEFKRMRWKTHFYLNPSDTQREQRLGGWRLKLQKTPPSNNKLNPLENDLFRLIQKISFRNIKNGFQAKIKGDIEQMRKSRKIWMRADKSKNVYQIS